MYKEFRIKNFKCFSDFSMDNLERVNLIAGENNVGKTALLEALFLNCDPYNPMQPFTLDSIRGVNISYSSVGSKKESPWDTYFTDFNSSRTITLDGRFSKGISRVLSMRVIEECEEMSDYRDLVNIEVKKPDENIVTTGVVKELELLCKENKDTNRSVIFVHQNGISISKFPRSPGNAKFLSSRSRALLEDASLFGELEKQGKQDFLLEVLRILEPRLNRLANIPVGGVTILHGDIGLSQMIPLNLMGEGMTRLASVILAISYSKEGVLIVDEIENGFHHSIMKKVWQAIGKAARDFNVQVFAATHSRECIIAAHQAFSENGKYDFRYHRLDKIKGEIKAVNYNQEILQAAIDSNFEVR